MLRAAPGAWGREAVFVYGFDDLTPLQRDAVETLAQYDVRLEPLLANLGWWVDATAAARAAVAEPVA